ncbi:metallophosphoesterase family protein [Marinobacterium litorale]|uniref:metallophosphoesterase family protein n=1 Tax=Marinobacterium litorale TaxID=404770 RepID=UPI0003F68B07|nr:metallophosphoesterase family protein [Marinobacterium litorale]
MRALKSLPDIKPIPTHRAIIDRLPTHVEPWDLSHTHSANRNAIDPIIFQQSLGGDINGAWRWPRRPIYFIADPHADAQAFIDSLVATGTVVKRGDKPTEFELNRAGKDAIYVIGGDCLDKGPSNLELLRAIRHLMGLSKRVKLLAGNHDVRLLMGIRTVTGDCDTTTEHLFVRMGDKVIPLFKEIHRVYLAGKKIPKKIPDEATCRAKLFPSEDWFEQFPREAADFMSEAAIERELKRMRKKVNGFETSCHKAGFTLREIYHIALTCRALFLKPKGEFSWFYREMRLAYRNGAFLFVHAGLDDAISEALRDKGVKHLNRQFRKQIKNDLFHFYFGPLANTMRTKYRPADLSLTETGLTALRETGIRTLVHGHINRLHGQRLAVKEGMLHIEGDITLDRNSRRKEGLHGVGAGVTVIHPDRHILGISVDYPKAKLFRPEACEYQTC